MGALTDLWRSERGLLALAILIAATVLCALGKMTIDAWQTFVPIVFGTYVAGKTASSVAEAIKRPNLTNELLTDIKQQNETAIDQLGLGRAGPQQQQGDLAATMAKQHADALARASKTEQPTVTL